MNENTGKNLRILVVSASALIIALFVPACKTVDPPAVPLERFEYKARHMGVIARIVVYDESRETAEAGVQAAFARIAELESVFSNYQRSSEISRLQQQTPGRRVPVSVDLATVADRVTKLWGHSGGAFDPTVGPLTALWRSTRASGVLPADTTLTRLRLRTGWQHVKLDSTREAGYTIQLNRPGLSLDFGGIAKGYACDEALRVLRERGLTTALVELGGDIVVGDAPPNTRGWRISGVEGGALDEIVVENAAVSTSGDTEQFVEINGIRYSHIIDPRTGYGLTNHTTVTVIAPDGLTADGLSTTISVLGFEDGQRLAATAFPGVQIMGRAAKR